MANNSPAEPAKSPAPDLEMLRIYWQTQYARAAQLEDQRLQFSNFVVAASVVAMGLTVAVDDAWSAVPTLVAFAVAASNLIAVRYSGQCNRLALMHINRGRALLTEHWPYLADLVDRIDGPDKAQFGSTISLHQRLHLVLIVTTVGLMIATVAGW